jgi:hypothetical protein
MREGRAARRALTIICTAGLIMRKRRRGSALRAAFTAAVVASQPGCGGGDGGPGGQAGGGGGSGGAGVEIGTWAGQTDQGERFCFEVDDAGLARFDITFAIDPCRETRLGEPNTAIADGALRFTIDEGGIATDVFGEIQGAGAAGSYDSFEYGVTCTDGAASGTKAGGTWTAQRQDEVTSFAGSWSGPYTRGGMAEAMARFDLTQEGSRVGGAYFLSAGDQGEVMGSVCGDRLYFELSRTCTARSPFEGTATLVDGELHFNANGYQCFSSTGLPPGDLFYAWGNLPGLSDE